MYALSFCLPLLILSFAYAFLFQDNRLDSLPDGIFTLPTLQLLDVSNNKLSSLPYKIWTAPKLRELNASLNLLHDLPVRPEGQGHDSGNVLTVYLDFYPGIGNGTFLF